MTYSKCINMKILNKIIIVIFLLTSNSLVYANDKDSFFVFKNINDLSLYIDESNYKDQIRTTLLDQPEFQYINSLSAEESFNLKYAQRNRFPVISGNIINDESLDSYKKFDSTKNKFPKTNNHWFKRRR